MTLNSTHDMAAAFPHARGVTKGRVVDGTDRGQAGVGWAAARHHKGFIEKLKRADGQNHQYEKGRRAKQRQRDIEEALTVVGAVDGGGLVQLQRDGLQARPENDDGKADVLPQCENNNERFWPMTVLVSHSGG